MKMQKIADSAAIRHHMPTGPRHSCESGDSRCVSAAAGMADTASPLLVLPVGIFGMFHIPQRPPARDDGNRAEVVLGRRGCRGPFERPRVPRIVGGLRAFEVRPD